MWRCDGGHRVSNIIIHAPVMASSSCIPGQRMCAVVWEVESTVTAIDRSMHKLRMYAFARAPVFTKKCSYLSHSLVAFIFDCPGAGLRALSILPDYVVRLLFCVERASSLWSFLPALLHLIDISLPFMKTRIFRDLWKCKLHLHKLILSLCFFSVGLYCMTMSILQDRIKGLH